MLPFFARFVSEELDRSRHQQLLVDAAFVLAEDEADLTGTRTRLCPELRAPLPLKPEYPARGSPTSRPGPSPRRRSSTATSRFRLPEVSGNRI